MPKTKENKFKSRIELNYNVYIGKYLQLKYAVSIPEKKSLFTLIEKGPHGIIG